MRACVFIDRHKERESSRGSDPQAWWLSPANPRNNIHDLCAEERSPWSSNNTVPNPQSPRPLIGTWALSITTTHPCSSAQFGCNGQSSLSILLWHLASARHFQPVKMQWLPLTILYYIFFYFRLFSVNDLCVGKSQYISSLFKFKLALNHLSSIFWYLFWATACCLVRVYILNCSELLPCDCLMIYLH